MLYINFWAPIQMGNFGIIFKRYFERVAGYRGTQLPLCEIVIFSAQSVASIYAFGRKQVDKVMN